MFTRILLPVLTLIASVASLSAQAAGRPPAPFELRSGDRVILLGDTLIEQDQYHGWVEVMLTSRFPQENVTFRNLGWSADTPSGTSRFGLSLKQAGREPEDEGWQQLLIQLRQSKATVALIGYGMASSFDGAAGLATFARDYRHLLETLAKELPGIRCLLLTPLPHERLGPPWPDPTTHNQDLARYASVIAEIARERNLPCVPLFERLTENLRKPSGRSITHNGIHLSPEGYRLLAEVLEDHLFGQPGAWRTQPEAETLRQAILRKNEWFFHRSRPANMAYIFGFRKSEQGRNATEILQFDAFVAAEEERIARLRSLQTVDVPPVPRRVGNLGAVLKPQPHPSFEVAEGLEVTLWAENPLMDKPIQMNFDPRGRLWIAASEVYPQIEPGQALTDKIIVLEDTTGAGRADKATVFADGLLIPTGIEPGDGGCYVAQSTELLHFKDTDGDGKADVRRTVLSGFGTEDTHHNLHTLRWGPDGRLTMNQSVYTRTDTETPTGVVRLKAGGVFRFDPRDQRMSVLYRGWINAWGHQFDEYGQSFVTDGAGGQGINWAVPGATYVTMAPSRRILQSVSPGRYPKFCGIEIIRSPLFPADWQGNVITADFRAHRLVRFSIGDQDSGYVTQELPDLLRTTDSTFRPIDLKLGPDGALYVADWSNPIIQHGEVDFRDPRRDKEHGRIWRIAPKGSTPLARENLEVLGNTALLDRLNSRLGYTQAAARRVLVERGAAVVASDLTAWTNRQTDDQVRLGALWMHQALNLPPGALLAKLLSSAVPEIRAAAVRALPADQAMPSLRTLVSDAHPRVRLEAVRALGTQDSPEAATLALGVLGQPMDPFIDYALWLTINELASPWLAALESGAWTADGRESQLQFALSAVEPSLAGPALARLLEKRGLSVDGSGPWIELIGSAGDDRDAGRLLELAADPRTSGAVRVRALSSLTQAARLRNVVPAGDRNQILPLLSATDEAVRIATLSLVGAWKLPDAVAFLLQRASQPPQATDERAAVWTALRDIGGQAVGDGLLGLVRSTTSPAQRREAVVALAGLELETALPEIPVVLQATTDPAEYEAVWRGLLSIKNAGSRLSSSLSAATLSPANARLALRLAREGGQNPALVQTLMHIAGIAASSEILTPPELAALARESLQQGDPVRGERIYRRAELACVVCHAIGGAGGKVGPDLTSIGASAPPDYLVESLLYPNAKTKEGYHAVSLSTRDLKELSGVIAKENDREISLRTADNQVVSVPKQSITQRTDFGSLMPAGLVDGLKPEELRDLVRFLSALGKPGDFDAARGGIARTWKILVMTAENPSLKLNRVTAGDPTLPDWATLNSLTSGSLDRGLIADAIGQRAVTRGVFLAARFTSNRAGTAAFELSGAARGAWINGHPVKPGASLSLNVTSGTNVLVLEVDHPSLPNQLSLRSRDVDFTMD